MSFQDIFFYETGYSIYTLRQASRRSWRIGQRNNVNVKFFHYAGTMQETCVRLMGKKLLVSLAMEGKFANDGLQAIDEGDDILMAMARELVTEKGIGEVPMPCGNGSKAAGGSVRSPRCGNFPIGSRSRSSSRRCAEVIIPPPTSIPEVVTQLLMFGMSPDAVQHRKASRRSSIAATSSDQLGLFSN